MLAAINLSVRGLPCGPPNRSSAVCMCKLARIAAISPMTRRRIALLCPSFLVRAGRLWDLLPVVRNHVHHPAFAGSYSIKSVLPALVPGMTYEGMGVANGQDAGLAWNNLVRGNLDQTERDTIERALRAYCGQDTMALVRLLDQLRAGSD